ncbi:periplasmic protein [Calothrix sp. 336/3]|nr:periplasmic protein [Calothrix sp. 336/3]
MILSLVLTIFGIKSATVPTSAQSIVKNRQVSQLPTHRTGQTSGNQISLNGRILTAAWLQQRTNGLITTHLSDATLRQIFGVDLLNTNNPQRQPIQWYYPLSQTPILTAKLLRGYRYLDITDFAQDAGWQLQVSGNTLIITTQSTRITDIQENQGTFGQSISVNLDNPAPWQIIQGLPIAKNQPQIPPDDPDNPIPKPNNQAKPTNREWTITIDGIADTTIIQRYQPEPLPNLLKQLLPGDSTNPIAVEPLITKVEIVNNQTVIKLSVPFNLAPSVATTASPHRLIINVRPDALVPRDITWAEGIRWRQQYIILGQERFPVIWLEINSRTPGLQIKPIVPNSQTMEGTAPLMQIAQNNLAYAAINGGFFNRNNRLPLGAIRRDGRWLSSPILNRGAIAWDNSGKFAVARLSAPETLITENNQRLPILFFNSGYVQSGIARYTSAWGDRYTPLTDNEIVLVVENNQITNQIEVAKVGKTPISIPLQGYLLALRAGAISNISALNLGSKVRIITDTFPQEFNLYSQILGAGPLLIQNNRIVLDATAEKFSNAFVTQKAVRSAICHTNTGNLILAAVQNRVGGSGATLTEHAQLMQQMGCVNALNLDGGSSTSLYLGGQLLDRSPNTAARVHNGIGIFLETPTTKRKSKKP